MCNIINTLPNAVCAFELLGPPENADQTTVNKYYYGTIYDPESVLRKSFTEEFRNHPKAPCVWGIKVFPEHVSEASLAWLWKHSKKVIILERTNITAQLLSLLEQAKRLSGQCR